LQGVQTAIGTALHAAVGSVRGTTSFASESNVTTLRYAVSKAHRVAAEQSKSAESEREKADLFRQIANANFASNNISAFSIGSNGRSF
jgi:hypothetical protein